MTNSKASIAMEMTEGEDGVMPTWFCCRVQQPCLPAAWRQRLG